MGISDEDYARALKLQQAFAVQQMKIEVEKQKEEAKMTGLMSSLGGLLGGQQQALQPNGLTQQQAQQMQAAQNSLSYNSATSTWLAGTGTQATPIGLKVLTEENLQHDAMKAPLSALIDMWTVRWQGEWVNESEFDNDDFWRLALIRLTGANKLEKHNLANQYRSVYRIIE